MRVLLFFSIFPLAAFAQLPAAFDIHLAAGKTAIQQSRYAAADTELRAAIAAVSQLDPASLPLHVVDAYSTLCDLDLLMGRYDEAIALATQASAAVAAITPPEDLMPHLTRLAGAYRAGGKTRLAVPVLERVLSIDTTKLGADDPKVSVDYDKLGSAYMELQDTDNARAAYQRALDTRISKLGPDHLDVATSWVNLGILEDRNVRYKDAQTDFEKALAISEKNLGTESYGLTGILDRLGNLFSHQKLFSDAEPVFQRSLAIRERVLGARHSDVAPALENLATAYFFDLKYADAEPLFQRALQIWISTQGETSPLVAQALDNLGSLYSAEKRYADAEPLLKRALSIRESVDIESLWNLALVYQSTNDMRRADTYFQRADLIGEQGLGGDHTAEMPDIVQTYATMLRTAGRLAEAKKMDAHWKELNEKVIAQKAVAAAAAKP